MRATAGLLVTVLLLAACSADDDAAPSTPASTFVSGSAGTDEPPTPTTNGVSTTTVAPTTRVETTQAETTEETTQVQTTAPAVSTAAPPQCPSLAKGVSDTTLTAGGETHDVRVFVPSTYAESPLPVVIDWHGLDSDGPTQAFYSDYEAVAEAEGFIVVHPTGVADAAGGPNSWQLFPSPGGGRDDLAFAGALIDELTTNWCADPARVYSTGMSNGGFFTARLICEMADRIAAAVSVAGTYHPDSCHPARDVPYLAIHGTDDKVVPYLGGESTLAGADSDPALRVFFQQVIPDEFAEFATDAGCDPTTVDTDVGNDVIQHAYAGCEANTPMIFDEVQGGGHTWPSSPLASFTEGALGYTTDDIDATRDGWAFVSQFTL